MLIFILEPLPATSTTASFTTFSETTDTTSFAPSPSSSGDDSSGIKT